MVHLLIVDDEKFILDGLYDLFNEQAELDLTVFKAASAFEALAILSGTKIDIVLTDIHMPKMSGLEMMEQVKAKWPRCRIIFLTGYDEFDYIYKAIQHGNVKYILKSDGDHKIIQIVADSIRELEASLIMETLLADAQVARSKQTDHMRCLFFTDVLDGLLCADDGKQHELLQLDIQLDRDDPLLMVIVRLEGLQPHTPRHEVDDLFIALQTICLHYLSPLAKLIHLTYNRTYLVLLLQPFELKKASWNGLITFVAGTLETIQQACKKNLNTTISLAWLTEPVQWEAIPQKFSFLKLLFLYHHSNAGQLILTEKNRLETDRLRAAPSELEHLQLLKKELGRLSHLFETSQKAVYLHSLGTIEEILRQISLDDSYALEMYYSLSLHAVSVMNKLGVADDVYYRESIGQLAACSMPPDWNEVLPIFRELANSFFHYQESQGARIQDDVIIKIKRYIKENLKEDLSLTRLSELVFLNPDYLSRLFRQRGGVTLSEYIVAQKISEAKHLLMTSPMLIQDVAKQLGFSTAGYFTRFFKKETGLTPEEYRSSQ
ncbi:two-component system, response regulator YesN [Paenibacillaceae bacterium GAS479]|nr:two-component system, response regulator YesN [Paenibacillaceae bacterium GAS479]